MGAEVNLLLGCAIRGQTLPGGTGGGEEEEDAGTCCTPTRSPASTRPFPRLEREKPFSRARRSLRSEEARSEAEAPTGWGGKGGPELTEKAAPS